MDKGWNRDCPSVEGIRCWCSHTVRQEGRTSLNVQAGPRLWMTFIFQGENQTLSIITQPKDIRHFTITSGRQNIPTISVTGSIIHPGVRAKP